MGTSPNNSDAQGVDQNVAELHATAAFLYTSGHSVGQLVAMLLGAVLGSIGARQRGLAWPSRSPAAEGSPS
jgi:hypothetical protein